MAKTAQTPAAKQAAQNADTFLVDDLIAFYLENKGSEWSAKRRNKTDNESVAKMRGLANAHAIIARRRMANRGNGGAVSVTNTFASI